MPDDDPPTVVPFKRRQAKDNGAKKPKANVVTAAQRIAAEIRLAHDTMAILEILPAALPRLEGIPDEPDNQYPRPLTETDVTRIQAWLQTTGLPRIGRQTVLDAVLWVSRANAFHPVRDYLEALTWDGRPRLERWLPDYLDTPDSNYTRAIGRMFLIAMVARVVRPGCQADYMLILEGPQGYFKSTACRILGGAYFSESLPDVTLAKDAMQHLTGKWLIEIAELSAINRAEASQLKAFLSRTVDRYRPTFGRLETQRPRQCLFIGTTNDAQYLRDQTGNRRFWPVRCGKIQIDDLKRDRDQLFAEALSAFRNGEPWWPDATFEAEVIAAEQDDRYEDDAWQDDIEDWLSRQLEQRFTISQIAQNALRLDSLFRLSRADQNRIMRILERLGWIRAPRTKGRRWWVKTL